MPVSVTNRRILFLLLLFFACAHALSTNTTTTTANDNRLVTKVTTFVTEIWKDIKDRTSTEPNLLNGTNGTTNLNETSAMKDFWNKPFSMNHVKIIGSGFLTVLSQLFIVFGGVLPYIPQYSVIKRTQNAEGFSNYVCLTLLVANILRIEFWYGKRFETPLLLQSIVMIFCMLVMLELWTRVHANAMLRRRVPNEIECISASKEQLTDENGHMRFIDFKVEYFWRWTKFSSYLQFLFLLTVILSVITWIFSQYSIYVETLGLMAVLCEALLGIPQFLRNFRLKSTEGMSVKMVLLWAAGDIFKTVYFIINQTPIQFWICGILQITIDVAILGQVLLYANKRSFRQQTA